MLKQYERLVITKPTPLIFPEAETLKKSCLSFAEEYRILAGDFPEESNYYEGRRKVAHYMVKLIRQNFTKNKIQIALAKYLAMCKVQGLQKEGIQCEVKRLQRILNKL